MNVPKTRELLATLLTVALSAACSKQGQEPHAGTKAAEHVAPGAEKPDAHQPASGGHDHVADEERSDLDRPAAELLAATCEHDVKTHECDECRYEVGVVEADESLFAGGLLTKSTPEKRRVGLPLRVTGEVSFDERRVAHVSTQAEGIIRKVHVAPGDRVERGQALVEISSVTVAEAQASLTVSESVLELARKNQERVRALRQEKIASEKELLAVEQELEVAEIRAKAERVKLHTLGAGSQGGIVLRTPVVGTVLDMHAVAGETARPDVPLLTVGDNSAVWVWADLYERDIAAVTGEQSTKPLSATIEVKAYPGEQFGGTVDFVSPAMSEASRTVKVRIAVPNSERRLLAGMFAEVKLFVPTEEEALTIPSQAVVEDAGRAFVFVHQKDGYYLRRPVEVGRTFAGFTEVTRGLRGHEVVVTQGAFLMKSDVLRSKMGAGCAD